MSRRQTLPPVARDLLADLAKSLRSAEGRAKEVALKSSPGEGIVSSFSRAAIEGGYLGGICAHAAADIDRILTFYPPKAVPR